MVKRLTAMAARQSFGQLLEEVYYHGDQYVIERAGQPMAAVVPLKFLEKYKESKKRLVGLIGKAQARNKRVSPRVLEREVSDAVRAVRTRKAR